VQLELDICNFILIHGTGIVFLHLHLDLFWHLASVDIEKAATMSDIIAEAMNDTLLWSKPLIIPVFADPDE
jgi:hypothetical protein